MAGLRDTLKACAERLDRHRRPNQRIGEQNTKVMLIEPVLQALGWDLLDPEEVNREYRRRGADNPVDYALLLLRTPRLFVEAKGIGENIDDPRWANQTIAYAAVAGVEWVVLTDGAQWRIYNAHAPVPVEDKLFRSVDVAADPDGAVELLELLSKENMRENRIQELWQGFFVDRQVHAVLTGLFSGTEPPNDLVSLLVKRTERLSKDDVRASLIRARATFDFPRPGLTSGTQTFQASQAPPAPRSTLPPPGASPGMLAGSKPDDATPAAPTAPVAPTRSPGPTGRAGRPQRRPVSTGERAIRLVDLLEQGRIAGEVTSRYDEQTWVAQLQPDGSLRFQGTTYASPSSAGTAVKLASRGPDLPRTVAATDGWDFWSTRDLAMGDVAKLKEIRRRAAQTEADPPRP